MNNEEKIFDEKGSLLLFRKATEDDIDLMLKLMSSEKYEFLSILRTVVSSDIDLVKLLDMMSGARVTFPERRKVYKTLEKVFIYNYIKSRDFSQQSYVAMAKQYNKRVTQVKAIVETMIRVLEKDSKVDEETYNNIGGNDND